MSELRTQPSDPSRPWTRRALPFALYAVFVGLLIVQESELLAQLAGEHDRLPSLWTWRLLWPLGSLGVALILPSGARWFFLGAVGVASSFSILIDDAYFAFFQSVTSLDAAVAMRQVWDMRDSVVELIQPRDLFLMSLYLALPAYGFLRLRRPTLRESESRWLAGWRSPAIGAGLLAAALGLWQLAWSTPVYEETHHLNRANWVKPADHFRSNFSNRSFAATFGVYNYHLTDLTRGLIRRTSVQPLDGGRRDEIVSALEHKRVLNERESPLFGLARGRNVLIVQLESFQHFLLDLSVGGREITPNLNALARRALRFDEIMDVTHVGRTSDAEFAVLTGLLPDTRKAAAFYHVGSSTVSLPRELARRGYRTASFHGNDPSFWNRSYTHPAYGIRDMYFDKQIPSKEILGIGTPDGVVYDFVADRLAEWRDQPSFSFVISLSCHHPYVYAPRAYAEPFLYLAPREGFGLLGPYLASASYADEALGHFMSTLEKRGLLENTLVVIYGDHDMGGMGASRPLAEVGPAMFTPREDRVPFLILVPGQEEKIASERARYLDVVGGLHDVFPTIMHLLGEPTPFGVMGTHLFVENAARDPLPLPSAIQTFGYRGALSSPLGVEALARDAVPASALPSFQEAQGDQILVRDLLDHPSLHLQQVAPAPNAPPERRAAVDGSGAGR